MSSLNGFDSVPAKEPNLGLAADFCKACLRLCIIHAVCVHITIMFSQNHISLDLEVTGGKLTMDWRDMAALVQRTMTN